MYDTRLLGTWRSDRRRTERDVTARRDIPAKARRGFLPIFGHLTLRYTRTRCYAEYQGDKDSWSYRVLGKSADSVVIEGTSGDGYPEGFLRQLHFESLGPKPRFYWICLGNFREFFRRI